jgi:signal transduction histidine kinase
VVRNFVSNALKFTPPDGIVTISVSVSHVRDGDGAMENHKNLTVEEVVLVANSKAKASNNPSTGDDEIRLKPVKGGGSSELRDDADDKAAVVDEAIDDLNLHSVAQNTAVDGKEHQQYGDLIVSFVDTGAGIAKV